MIDQALLLFGPAQSVYAAARCAAPRRDGGRRHVRGADARVRSPFALCGCLRWPRSPARGSACSGSGGAFVKYGLDVQEDALRSGVDPRSPGWGVEPPEMWGRLGTGDDTRSVMTEPGAYPRFYSALVTALRSGGALPVDPAGHGGFARGHRSGAPVACLVCGRSTRRLSSGSPRFCHRPATEPQHPRRPNPPEDGRCRRVTAPRLPHRLDDQAAA